MVRGNKNYRIFTMRVIVFSHFMAAAFCGFLSARTAKEDSETFFSDLDRTFQKISTAAPVRQSKLSPVNNYFVDALKVTQQINTLIRTNTKGVVINEVIRGERSKTDYRGVSNQKWFRDIIKNREPYYGYLKESNGRYYLFWARPVFSSSKKPKLLGTIAMKIDLWDCFQALTDIAETSFSVRLANFTLYSFRWNKTISYREFPLIVPGIEKITIRVPN